MYSNQVTLRPPINMVTWKALVLLTNSKDPTSKKSSSNSPEGTGLMPCHSAPDVCPVSQATHRSSPWGQQKLTGPMSPEWGFGPSRGGRAGQGEGVSHHYHLQEVTSWWQEESRDLWQSHSWVLLVERRGNGAQAQPPFFLSAA